MANPKIDSIQFSGSTTKYDINLPTTATPSIAGLTVNGDTNINGMLRVNPNSTGLPSAIVTPMIYGTTSNGLLLGNWIAAANDARIELDETGIMNLSADKSLNIKSKNNDVNINAPSTNGSVYISAQDILDLNSSKGNARVTLGSNRLFFPRGKDGTIALKENYPAYSFVYNNYGTGASPSSQTLIILNGYINYVIDAYTSSTRGYPTILNADLWLDVDNEETIGIDATLTLGDALEHFRSVLFSQFDIPVTTADIEKFDAILYDSINKVELNFSFLGEALCKFPLCNCFNQATDNGYAKIIKFGTVCSLEYGFTNRLNPSASQYYEPVNIPSGVLNTFFNTTDENPSFKDLILNKIDTSQGDIEPNKMHYAVHIKIN